MWAGKTYIYTAYKRYSYIEKKIIWIKNIYVTLLSLK